MFFKGSLFSNDLVTLVYLRLVRVVILHSDEAQVANEIFDLLSISDTVSVGMSAA